MNNEIIILENICKNYPFEGREFKDRSNLLNFFTREKFQAITDVSLNINNADTVGFLGKNGAGKTILLKIISGIVYPTSGRVIVTKPISPIFEFGAGFHPEFSGVENIFLYGSLLDMSRKNIENKLDEIVAFSELENFLGFKLKHYSTGMKTRLAFSIASILKPDILILDEALSAGDEGFVRKVHEKIFQLQRQGVTMLITSHSQEILKKFCTSGIVLNKGRLIYSGTIHQAINYYKEEVLMNEVKSPALSHA